MVNFQSIIKGFLDHKVPSPTYKNYYVDEYCWLLINYKL